MPGRRHGCQIERLVGFGARVAQFIEATYRTLPQKAKLFFLFSILNNPLQCKFDVSSLACGSGETNARLSTQDNVRDEKDLRRAS